jgi:hypothetical protein
MTGPSLTGLRGTKITGSISYTLVTSGTKKQKTQLTEDSGAAIAAEEDIPEPEEVMMVDVTWMQPYLAYMAHKTLPKDVVKARRIVR